MNMNMNMNPKTLTSYTILISLAIAVSSRLVTATNNPALDVDGHQLRSNTKYHVITTTRRGGVALSIRDRRDPCPPNVVQESGGASVGPSLKLFPADGREEVYLQSDLNFVFMAATVCVQRTVWRLGGADRTTGRRYVRTNGEVGRPGPATVGNWFKIERFGEGYSCRVLYCPSVCSTCRVACGVVGVYVEKGRRWLGLGGQPLLIAFKKVNESSSE